MAIELSRPELTSEERANLLSAMGAIARYSEPSLQMEDGGKSYFDAAQRICPEHLYSAIELMSLYLEKPDGHTDRELAALCMRTILNKMDNLSQEDRELVHGAKAALASRGVTFDDLSAQI